MKKPEVYTVTEYQKIVSDEFVSESGDGYVVIPSKAFSELVSFVKEYDNNNDYDSLDFFSLGHNHHLGDYVSAKNYVGLIELKSSCQIQILPKMELGESDSETKEIFRKMLSSMKDFPAKISESAALKDEEMSLYEVFIRMYVSDVQKLLKTGLKSNYVSVEDNLNKVKGKILINQHIKKNVAHNERFYVQYDEYQINTPENRIIKTTLNKLDTLSSSEITKASIKKLLSSFEEVDVSYNYEKDFSQVVLNRNMYGYRDLMRWSKVFLFDKSFLSFSGKNNARALLFPMEKLFESYIAQELSKVIGYDWTLSTQDQRFYLFDEPNIFKLRPDLVLTRDDKKIVVMDTKWKKLIPNPRKNYGISQSDMYQMYAYSKKYQASDIWVIYPETSEMNNKTDYSFVSNTPEGENTTIHLFFVNMGKDKITDCLRELMLKCK